MLVNNAGILRDGMSFSMAEDEWDIVVNVHLKGHFCTTHFAGVHWRQLAKETGEPVDGVIVNTASRVGPVRQRRPGQLRRGQGRHRVDDHRGGP